MAEKYLVETVDEETGLLLSQHLVDSFSEISLAIFSNYRERFNSKALRSMVEKAICDLNAEDGDEIAYRFNLTWQPINFAYINMHHEGDFSVKLDPLPWTLDHVSLNEAALFMANAVQFWFQLAGYLKCIEDYFAEGSDTVEISTSGNTAPTTTLRVSRI